MAAAGAEATPVVSWPGYGILVFLQLGVLAHLNATRHPAAAVHVGSSAGAMAAAFAVCQVDPRDAIDAAAALCDEYRVWDRPLGLVGVWGSMVRAWLRKLLPADAAARCSGRVRVVVTTLPALRRVVVSEFKDREDLIEACLASAHLPLLLDWRPAALWRGMRCVDGSLLYVLTRRCAALRPAGVPLLLLDPMGPWGLLNLRRLLRCVSLCGRGAALALLSEGEALAQSLDRAGLLDVLPQRAERVEERAEGGAPPPAGAGKGAGVGRAVVHVVACTSAARGSSSGGAAAPAGGPAHPRGCQVGG